MGSCKDCALYSEHFDNLNRDFNDIGNENDHFCMMYQDFIPFGIYDGNKDCEYYTEKENKQ